MKKRIGIVGGGQLGRMLGFAAKRLGYTVTVIDPTPNSPAGQVVDKQIAADFNDEKAIVDLARQSDYLTFEIENTNGLFLDKLEKKVPCIINPSGKSWRMFQDKLEQKKLFAKAGVPQPEFVIIHKISDFPKAIRKLGLPFVLKARFDSYDGRGNAVIRNERDIGEAWEKLHTKGVYAEKFIPFRKELAIMIARSSKGEIVAYPVAETIQTNNICHAVIAPARISSKSQKKATAMAMKTVKLIRGAGVFGIEMFLTNDNKVLMNEIAPRVHNSGHYTIEGCITDQFEQHIRAIAGLPLGRTDMVVPAAVMVNILGKRLGESSIEGLDRALRIPGVSVHIYEKAQTKPERKMGHITAIDTTPDKAYKKALKARKYISI